jgi:uncharacterized protein YjbJ (UPF0337 family)
VRQQSTYLEGIKILKGVRNMNDDVLKGLWKQLKGRVQEKWGELTDDEIDQVQGKREVLIGKIQEKYGYARDEAEREVNNFLDGIQVK